MGVTGLWQLVSPVGKPVTLESLENKTLAVDVSIWLNQALKGFRDGTGSTSAHAHLVTLCNRICKLLFYRIKPIFVFDGTTPQLKKQTLAARERQRQKSRNNMQETTHRILTNYLANEAIQGGSKKKSPTKKRPATRPEEDIFHLPPVNQTGSSHHSSSRESSDDEETVDLADIFSTSTAEARFQDLSSVNIDSPEFKNLPPDIRYEILSVMKDNRRRHNRRPLPQDSQEFSNFQLGRLLERSRLQQGMDSAAKELSQRQVGDLMLELCQDPSVSTDTHRIVSEDAAMALLIRTAPKPKENVNETSSQKSSILEDMNEFVISSSDEDVDEPTEGIQNASTNDKDIRVSPITAAIEVQNSAADLKMSQDKILSEICNVTETENPVVSKSKTNEDTNTDPVAKWFMDIEKNEPAKPPPSSATVIKENEASKLVSSSANSNLETKQPKIINGRDQSDVLKTVVDLEREDVPNSSKLSGPVSSSDATENTVLSEENSKSSATKSDSELRRKVEILPVKEKTTSKEVTITVDLNHHPSVDDDLFPLETFQQSEKIVEDNEIQILTSRESSKFQNEEEKEEIIEVHIPKEVLNASSREEALAVLEAEREQLLQDRGRHQRQAQTLSQQILLESQELLRLFGVPYVVSPTEAEAQCAALESLRLTQGTITDDSDIWLFGGHRVYRHFFQQDKYVQLYTKEDIHTHFGLNREKLVCFAMLTGSDYTEGVEGVGVVTAMEILAEFKGDGLQTLSSLKSWWDKHHNKKVPPGNAMRAKLTSLRLSDSFPREDVFQAYLEPEVDFSTEKFSWQVPDLCALRELLNGKLGWKMEKINDMLVPVIRKFNETQSQTHLDSFFTVSLKAEAILPPSKRLQKALEKFHPRDEGEKRSRTERKTSAPKKTRPTERKMPIPKMTRPRRGANTKAVRGTRNKRPSLREDFSDPDEPQPMTAKQARSTLSESSSDSSPESTSVQKKATQRLK